MQMRPSAVAVAGLVAAACGGASARTTSADSTRVAIAFDSSHWAPPPLAALGTDSVSASVRRGLALITATHDSLPLNTGGNVDCGSCHLDAGRRRGAALLAGSMARYPRFVDRSAAVASIEDRVNYCFTRSLAGAPLPDESRAMHDIVAYLAFLSRGVPVGAHVAGEGMATMPPTAVSDADSARGVAVYTARCARCHGADGAGMAAVPALWGARSFSIGASMARLERAASFIRYNMPFDAPGTLSDREAADVAAYVTSQPRPDHPNKTRDWPEGGAPADVPYDTRGHRAFRPPPVLPRRPAISSGPANEGVTTVARWRRG